MRRRFNADELMGDWFRPIVIAVALLFHFTTCQASSPERLRKTNSEQTVQDFQDVKQEVGYSDPQRFGKKQMEEVKEKLMSGQEKLLALNSYRIKDSQKMIDRIEAVDADPGFKKFTLKLLDHLGLGIEEMNDRSYLPTQNC